MFDRFFSAPKSPEQAEKHLEKMAEKELSDGVNGHSMFSAFNAIKKENKAKGFNLTNNHLLNIVRDSALYQSSVVEDSLYGGQEQTTANIKFEIENLRKSLTDEEPKS